MSETHEPGTILKKEMLAESTVLLRIHQPHIARKVKPGQFVMVLMDERSERIPLTVADWSEEEGWIDLIFLEVGYSTKRLGSVNPGYMLMSVTGPLGNPTDLSLGRNVAVVTGGVGIAAAYPIARGFKGVGARVHAIMGAKSGSRLFYIREMRDVCDSISICTEDGSVGERGLVTDLLRSVIESGERFDLVHTVGPAIMMYFVAELTRGFGIKTVASLNPIMLCGMGMCGACRVTVAGETMFTCVDGPEFDAHEVDFDELLKRLQVFREEEQLAMSMIEARG